MEIFPPDQKMSPAAQAAIRQMITREMTQTSVPAPCQRWLPKAAWRAAIVAATAGVAAIAFNLSSPAAAWTPIPDSVSPDEVGQLRQECESLLRFSTLQPTFKPSGTVIAERRGTTRSVLVVSTDNRVAICIGQSQKSSSLQVGSEFAGVYELETLSTRLGLDGTPVHDSVRVAFGRAEPHLTQIKITTTDEKTVTASVVQGYFLAWWPSNAAPGEIQAFDVKGQLVDRVKLLQADHGAWATVPVGRKFSCHDPGRDVPQGLEMVRGREGHGPNAATACGD
jgi:hypothetical protein